MLACAANGAWPPQKCNVAYPTCMLFWHTLGILTRMPDVTTIKVPKTLRDRIAAYAADEGLTAHAFLQSLIESHERNKRLAAVAAAYRDASEEDLDSWREETEDWAAVDADGLDR